MVKVHPLAGKCGEGPPLAPDGWKWRAGNRMSDMYFTAPSGERFRSRPELKLYLAKLVNPPHEDSFLWRITEDFIAKNPFECLDVAKTPKKESGDNTVKSPKKQSGEVSSKAEKGEGNSQDKGKKRKEVVKDASKQRKKVKFDQPSEMDPKVESPVPSVQPPIPECSPLNATQPVTERSETDKISGFFVTPIAKPRPKMKASKQNFNKKWENDEFFSQVIVSRGSWKWLHDSEASTRFLSEGQKLNEKSDRERAELRTKLLQRSLDISNLTKYSNQVLRTFVQIMRDVHPQSTMSKVELADLLVNWKCKKRHFWCLLEISRMVSSTTSNLSVDGSSLLSTVEKTKKCMAQATASSLRVSSIASQDNTDNGDFVPLKTGGESGMNCTEDSQLAVTLKDIQESIKIIEETEPQLSLVDLNEKISSLADESNLPSCVSRDQPGEDFSAREQGSLSTGSVYNVQYKMSESVVILDRVAMSRGMDSSALPQDPEEPHADAVLRDPVMQRSSHADGLPGEDAPETPSFPASYHFPKESSVCWCKICSKDPNFCRGCMCCFCSKSVKPEDNWSAIRCDCKHRSHVSCALDNNVAGVVKDVSLDLELICPSCSRKVNLRPFFEKIVDRLCVGDVKDLETLPSLVLRLIEGTESKQYSLLKYLITEVQNLTTKCSVQNIIKMLLLEMKDELQNPLRSDLGDDLAAERSMQVAAKKRAEISSLIETLGQAYQGITDQTKQIRQTYLNTEARDDGVVTHMEDDEEDPAFAQQVEDRQQKAEQEFQRLVQLKSTPMKPSNQSLADIDSTAKSYLDVVRAQRKAVETVGTDPRSRGTKQR